MSARRFDAAIFDIRMPGMSGVELLQAVRERWPHLTVIMLTGHGDLESAMAAVKSGAFDYLLKPAQAYLISNSVSEAVAKSRRRQTQTHLLESLRTGLHQLENAGVPWAQTNPRPFRQQPLKIGDLRINPRSHEVYRSGSPVHLSPTEFNLLLTLASRLGEVIDYVILVKLGLGYEAVLWEAKELLKRHIFSVRQKIKPDAASPRYLLNVRGVGYRLASPDRVD